MIPRLPLNDLPTTTLDKIRDYYYKTLNDKGNFDLPNLTEEDKKSLTRLAKVENDHTAAIELLYQAATRKNEPKQTEEIEK